MEKVLMNLNDTCLTCLQNNQQLLNIHAIDGDTSFINMLMAVTSINLEGEKNLPTSVCTVCLKQLKAAFTFRNLCLASYNALRVKKWLKKEDDEETATASATDWVEKIKTEKPLISRLKLEPIAESDLSDSAESTVKNRTRSRTNETKKHDSCDDLVKKSSVKSKRKRVKLSTRFDCKVCGAHFSGPQGLRNHKWETDHYTKGYIKNRTKLKKVVKSAPNGSHACVFCDAIFSTRASVYRHAQRVHKYDPNEPDKILTKIEDRVDTKTYCCPNPECKEIYYSEHKLYQHQKENNHYSEKQLRRMIRCKKIPANENGKFACSTCQSEFISRDKLLRHELIHKEATIKCTECDKLFKTEESRTLHMAMHTGNYYFTCFVCGKQYTRHTSLNLHVRTHFPSTVKCEVCDKTFTQPLGLRKHMRIHTGERPYVCTVCNKTFNRQHILKRHEGIHTGVRPYACSLCPKTFRNKQNRDKHIRKHPFAEDEVARLRQ